MNSVAAPSLAVGKPELALSKILAGPICYHRLCAEGEYARFFTPGSSTPTPEQLTRDRTLTLNSIADVMVKQMLFMDPPRSHRLRSLASRQVDRCRFGCRTDGCHP